MNRLVISILFFVCGFARAETKTEVPLKKAKKDKREYFLGGSVVGTQATDILHSYCSVEEFLPVVKIEQKKDRPDESFLHFRMEGSTDDIKRTVGTQQIKKLKIIVGMRLCGVDDNENRD